MPIISGLTTEVANSTSDMVLNVGSTTRRANVGQIVGGIFTSQGQIAYAASSRDSTFLNPPTSGAVLAYSSATSAPSWSIPTTGAVLVASSVGVPTWRALGTSGQLLQSTGGTPTWVDGNTIAGTITTAGTSGQILQTTAGAAAWRASTAILRETLSGSGDLLITSSLGDVTRLPLGSSGFTLQSTGGVPTWAAGGAGGGTTNAWDLRYATSQVGFTTGAWNVTTGWQVEIVDTDGVHTTGAASSAVTIPTSGKWLMGVTAEVTGTTGDIIGLRIMNGTTQIGRVIVHHGGGVVNTPLLVLMHQFATSGDVLTVEFYPQQAAAISTDVGTSYGTKWWGHRLS